MATTAGAVRLALGPAIVEAVDDAEVQVTVGYPWPQDSADIIAVGGARVTLEAATVGPQRSRDETVLVDVLVSVYRAGGQEAEQAASDRAYALLDAVEHHLRMTDPTLGGLVRQILLTGHEMDSSAPFSDDTAQGRTVEVLATFTAKARIRN